MEDLMRAIQQRTSNSTTGQPFDPSELARIKAAAYNRTQGRLTGFECKKCLNRGFIMVVHDDGSTAVAECSCMGVRRSLKLLERSGLRDLVRQCKFSTFETPEPWQQKAKEIAQLFAEDPAGRWFLASGQPGCGKTHLCVSICRELMLKGTETLYCLWRETAQQLKSLVTDSQGYKAKMDELKGAPLLYIDDFLKVGGGGKPTQADLSAAFEIINARYLAPDKMTIISSERTAAELLLLDEAIGSRITERCKGAILTFTGKEKNRRLNQP